MARQHHRSQHKPTPHKCIAAQLQRCHSTNDAHMHSQPSSHSKHLHSHKQQGPLGSRPAPITCMATPQCPAHGLQHHRPYRRSRHTTRPSLCWLTHQSPHPRVDADAAHTVQRCVGLSSPTLCSAQGQGCCNTTLQLLGLDAITSASHSLRATECLPVILVCCQTQSRPQPSAGAQSTPRPAWLLLGTARDPCRLLGEVLHVLLCGC